MKRTERLWYERGVALARLWHILNERIKARLRRQKTPQPATRLCKPRVYMG